MSLPPEVRVAASLLVEDERLFRLVQTVGGSFGAEPGGRLRLEQLEVFLTARRHAEQLYASFDQLDVAAKGGKADGDVSRGDLKAAAVDPALPASVREAAGWLAANPDVFARLSVPITGGPAEPPPVVSRFLRSEDLLPLLVDGHAFADRPEAAAAFVARLPVPERGGRGIDIELLGDRGCSRLPTRH